MGIGEEKQKHPQEAWKTMQLIHRVMSSYVEHFEVFGESTVFAGVCG